MGQKEYCLVKYPALTSRLFLRSACTKENTLEPIKSAVPQCWVSEHGEQIRTKEVEKCIGRFYKILGIDTFFGDLDVGKGLVSARLAAEQA